MKARDTMRTKLIAIIILAVGIAYFIIGHCVYSLGVNAIEKIQARNVTIEYLLK